MSVTVCMDLFGQKIVIFWIDPVFAIASPM